MKQYRGRLRFWAVSLIACGSALMRAEAATWFVATNGNDAALGLTWAKAKRTIQAAIDAAAPSDTVLVSNGVYETGGRVVSGSLLTNRVVIDKAITVRSVNGPAVTTILGSGPFGDAAVRCVWMTNGATLVGFTLTNGVTRTDGDLVNEQSGGGLWAQSTSAVVSNCTLTGNLALYGSGAYGGTLINCTLTGNSRSGGARQSTLIRCVLTDNEAGSGGGAYQCTLISCVLAGNQARSLGGGAFQSTLTSCVLAGNQARNLGGGAYDSTMNNCALTGNLADGNGGGVFGGTLNNCIIYFNTSIGGEHNYDGSTISYSCTTPDPGGTGNITNDPMFVSLATTNLQLAAGSPCINRGDNAFAPPGPDLAGNPRIAFGAVDMGAYEYQTPPASGAVHHVALGNPNAGFPYTNWATAAATIQDAIDAAPPGNTVLVSNGVYETGGRVVPGTLLTNRVVIDKPILVQSFNGPSMTTIKGAWHPVATNGDAAVRCVWMTDGARLAGFTLTNGATRTDGDQVNEQSGGGVWAQSTSAILSNCVLIGNSALIYGGGAVQGTLNHCTLSGNSAAYGGGVYQGALNHSTLSGNSAEYAGGGAYESALNNCVLTGNSTWGVGGGAYEGTLNNCTVTGNSAAGDGGGVVGGTLNNCIVYFNSPGGNYFFGTINHTCTTPLPGGTGNIDANPQFVNAAAGNYRLLASSPCINSGDNANAPGATDLDGSARIVGATVDMGAYEYNQALATYDSDADGFTDAEEYIANTQPTNNASFFPGILLTNAPAGQTALVIGPTSTGRVYGVYANTNLLESPQTWTLVPPEQTGTASALTLTITNTLPGANYRTGVRLP